MRIGRSLLMVAAFAASLFAAGAASAHQGYEGRPWMSRAPIEGREWHHWDNRYTGYLPECDHAPVLDKIAYRFGEKEVRFWYSDALLRGFDKVREIAYRPWGPYYIPRRFCSARVEVQHEGRLTRHVVYYSIGEGTGFVGVGWGVEWCVTGFDRNLAYAPNCKMARP